MKTLRFELTSPFLANALRVKRFPGEEDAHSDITRYRVVEVVEETQRQLVEQLLE